VAGENFIKLNGAGVGGPVEPDIDVADQ